MKKAINIIPRYDLYVWLCQTNGQILQADKDNLDSPDFLDTPVFPALTVNRVLKVHQDSYLRENQERKVKYIQILSDTLNKKLCFFCFIRHVKQETK